MHSLETIKKLNGNLLEITIFSVDQKELTDHENYANFEETRQLLESKQIPFKVIEGCYKYEDGTICKENSFMVVDDNNESIVRLISSIATRYNQESVLWSDSNRDCLLYYPKNNITDSLGKLMSVSKQEALNSNAYSYDPSTDTYWVCK